MKTFALLLEVHNLHMNTAERKPYYYLLLYFVPRVLVQLSARDNTFIIAWANEIRIIWDGTEIHTRIFLAPGDLKVHPGFESTSLPLCLNTNIKSLV